MPRHCSAGGCKSRDNRETRNAGITFHKLPKGAARRNLWITNSHRADCWDPQTDFVYFCSKHFTPDSFELTGCSGIRRLKEDAFPTVFESSSTTKCKRAGTRQKQDKTAVRKSSSSDDQGNPQQETGEPTVQSSAAAAEQSHKNIPASPQEASRLEQLPQQESSSSPPSESRPSSPSRYMRRLPPPPGFYLSKEHSYAQVCPLLWRRRYDQAIDCLEKALRQLHAARRRENRLRGTVLRLRDKRLTRPLLVSRGGCKNRGSWTAGGNRARGTASNQDESEQDYNFEETGLFEDRCVEQMELAGCFLPHSKNWPEEEREHCFYCGRWQPTNHKHSLNLQTSVEGSTAQKDRSVQVVSLGRNLETSDSEITPSQILLQSPDLQQVIPTHEQSTQSFTSQQKLLLSDGCEEEADAVDPKHHLDLQQQQQQFWVHGTAEGHVILVSVFSENGPQSFVRVEEAVPVLDAEAASDDEHCDITSTSGERREDVREKLKEHLEGFHLQLSTEFLS